MDNRFPLFSGGRILKKESLWDVRDYTYGGWQLYYADYTDGLLQGCEIRVEEDALVVGKGMLKYGDFIYFMQEEVRVPYHPSDAWESLKARFTENREHPDYYKYSVDFFLDQELELAEGQLEMCRFYLRKGSWLRDSYKGFFDMATEYDTVQLIDASVAGKKMPSLHPSIMSQFASELWEELEKESIDYGFCFSIWNTSGMLDKKVISAYLAGKRKEETHQVVCGYDNKKIYLKLEEILRDFSGSKMKKQVQKRIIVD